MHSQPERPSLVVMRRRLRLIPEYLLAILAWGLIPFLPRRVVVALARWGGTLAWTFSLRERNVSLANLDLVFGDALSVPEKEAIGRRSFQSFSLTVLDLFWFSRFTESRYRHFVKLDEKVRLILAQKPLIGVTGHLGNWEIISMMYGMEGSPMTAVAMPLKNPFVDRMLYRLRMRTGSVPVAREGAIRHLLRTLRAKGVVGLVLDQNTTPQEGGVFVPFFGLPVAVSNAAGLLAVKTQAPLAVAVAYADARGVYQFTAGDIIHPVDRSDAEITLAVTQQLERLIRRHPEYWLWSYKRWRYYRACDDPVTFPYYASSIGPEQEDRS